MRTLTLIAIALLSVPSCTRYMHDGRRSEPAYHAHAAPYDHHHHHPHAAPCDRAGVVGLAIDRADDSPRSPLVVERVAPGGPAADANIRPGDRILEIDGESTRGMTEGEAARLIRGRVDTAVEIRIGSPHGDRIITLVRVAPSSVWGRPDHPRAEGRPCDHKRRCEHKRKCDKYECHKHKCDKQKCEKQKCAKGGKCAKKPCGDRTEHERCRHARKGDCAHECHAPCESRSEERAMVQPQHDGDDEPEDEGGDR